MLLAKVFSYLDGWHYLAKKYKKKSEFKGVRYKWCYAKLGIINHIDITFRNSTKYDIINT